jgi:hypothetical protein
LFRKENKMPWVSQPFLASLSADQRRALFSLGWHPDTHDVFFVPTRDRHAGMYVLGVQGSGKSSLLQNLITADMHAGNAVIVIDPHGDLASACLSYIPTPRLPQTFVLDMADEAYPFGVNLFSTGVIADELARSQAVERIMHIFEVLWEDVLSQANLPRYLRMATLVFLANPGKTLVDMYDFFLDDAVRRQMLAAVTDPTVKQFWQFQYDALPPATRMNKVQPLLGRLEQLFAGRTLVRNIVGQSNSSIDFRKSIEKKEILFIRLPLKQAEQGAQLIGTLLVSQIHAAQFSFVNLPPEQRPGTSLYIDEFQNFATEDIKELFTEGRKFGMRLIVAHQYRGQLPKFLQESTVTAYTKVCFRLTAKDGSELAHEFPAPEQGVTPEHVDPHPTETLLNHPHLHPFVVQVFIEAYLRPVMLQQVGAHGNKVKIHNPGYGVIELAGDAMFDDGNVKKSYEPEAENPLIYLDYLLQQVMVTGMYQTPIPSVAVRGFANCGVSFWQKVRWMGNNNRLLMADIPDLRIPAHFIQPLPDGSYAWIRQPESDKQQLLHFLYHLRATMRYLAANPLGSKTTVSNAEVGKMLSSLPNRSAFVRSGENVGTIYTYTTPKPLDKMQLFTRAKAILDATRRTYCHPRDDIQGALSGAKTPPISPAQPSSQAVVASNVPQPALSGWEEAE